MTSSPELKVVYIVGFARSGTTILGNLLGEIDGFFHMGELCRVWSQAVRARGRCGCENTVAECPFWSRVLSRTLSRDPGGPPHESSDAVPNVNGTSFKQAWEIQKRARSENTWRRDFSPLARDRSSSKKYVELLESLLHNVAEVSRSRVLIDSSKLPESGAYLRSVPSVTPFYLHMVRDSRGSIFSRQRRHAPWDGEKVLLNRVSAIADSFRWMRSNLEAEVLGRRGGKARHMVVRYESFASRPESTLGAIASWLGEDPDRLPLIDSRTAWIGPNHTVCGNRNRFQTGEVTLRVDDRWIDALRSRDYLLITSLTSPLLARYGYSWRRIGEARALARR